MLQGDGLAAMSSKIFRADAASSRKYKYSFSGFAPPPFGPAGLALNTTVITLRPVVLAPRIHSATRVGNDRWPAS